MSLLISTRLRGKARDWNWHNVIGFWSSTVLVVLTLTAAVMSYPWANDLVYTLTGSEPPRRADGPAGPVAQRGRARGQAGAARAAAPTASFDVLMTRAQEQVPGWVMIMLRFAPRGDGPVTASIQGPDAFHPFERSQLTLHRATGNVVRWEPYASNSAGRKLRTWVRALHTGEAFGVAGQTVAGLASLGGCFLVWTGLAMAWRRFRSSRRTTKESTTEESEMNANTDKINFPDPYHPEIERGDTGLAPSLTEAHPNAPNGANGHASAIQDLARERAAAPINGASILILYGTVTGNSETLAKKLADALRPTGLNPQVFDMAHCQPSVLKHANCVLVVASTYGDGEPPDDAAPFWQAIVHGSGLDLRGVKYSVLALSNTTYDHFCKCGRDFDAALERHGAIRIYPRVDCDVDYSKPAEQWIAGVKILLKQDSGLAASVY
jgi:flavodoxin